MNAEQLRDLLLSVQAGRLQPEQALVELRRLPFSDLGYARVDHHRSLRIGAPEVVFGEGKASEQIVGIVEDLILAGQNVLVTRVDSEKAERVTGQLPSLRYNSVARVLSYHSQQRVPVACDPVAIVTAGTSDIPVAEEAFETLDAMNVPIRRLFDVGVAGIHRLLAHVELLRRSPAVIVVAGMEGALPSVVGGLVGTPIVAVPTSVGYGAALGGMTALFGMLTGCAAGMTVVNIDNGFGAAMAVWRILHAKLLQVSPMDGETNE